MMLSGEQQIRLSREGLHRCFGCGQENPIGLKLRFNCDEDKAEAEFTPDELYQGWPGIVHGGIVFTLLDEAMTYAIRPQGINCLTAKTEIRFKRPALVGESLVVTASITMKRKRLIEARAAVTLKDGTIIAEGKSLMYVISSEK
jgi:uncharacterized protein (TIGR00369 family)